MGRRHGASIYTQAFPDKNALTFGLDYQEGTDASNALQEAIYQVVDERNYGVLYIAEGTYNITKTIYIPRSVRLIGFGKKRPVFVLPANTPGFDGTVQGADFGQSNSPGFPKAACMFWFTSNRPTENQPPADATAGTFYSGIANIDFRIEYGNPMAVCVRAHFAQNAFVSHCDFHVGNGLSALYEVGNEMENLAVYGGRYGILCRQTSPSWPFVLMDSLFCGQKEAAVASWGTGLTLFRIHIKDTPACIIPFGIGNWEKIYMEDCVFENIHTPAIQVDLENNSYSAINIRRLYCKNVPLPIQLRESGTKWESPAAMYEISRFVHGAIAKNMVAEHTITSIFEATPLETWIDAPTSDIPDLPDMNKWISVAEFGAVGDSETDDTAALIAAAASGKPVFFPEGRYRATNTVKLVENTQFIGMSPISTQIILQDDEVAFAGFGTPVPLIETSCGFNLVNSIGIDSGGKNPRAVACKWLANASSYMNDVKFVGGHGQVHRSGGWVNVYNANRTGDANPEKEWDFQYSSLWITESGGGVFKDIWSASPYAEAGITITNTKTPGKIYCTSLEHHVRHELKMRDVENWAFYALQTEEEKAEGLEALPIEMVNCKNIMFGNLWIFRTVYVNRPYPEAIRIWNCAGIEFANVHNYTQMQYVFDNLIYDPVKKLVALPWEAALISVTGDEKPASGCVPEGFEKIADGLTFGSGAAVDSKGNLVFCDAVQKRVYRWLAAEKRLELLCDVHWTPMCAVFDTQDNLAIVADVIELRAAGELRTRRRGEYHPYYTWFGPRGPKVYVIDPEDPYNTMHEITPDLHTTAIRIFRPAHAWTPITFLESVTKPLESYYVLPDGKTAIAGVEDIGRSQNLTLATPGEEFYMVDDALGRTYLFDVSADGSLSNPQIYTENGRFGVNMLPDGTIIVPDGYLYVTRNGKIIQRIRTPERVVCAAVLSDGIALICRNSVWIANFRLFDA